jgi:hypothetical protein
MCAQTANAEDRTMAEPKSPTHGDDMPPACYAEFWLHYLRAHSRPGTRRLHYLGTALGTLALATAIAKRDWRLVPVALAAGYAPAWIGHFGVERNRPATFGHPLWSFVSDYRMAALALGERLGPEMAKAGIEQARKETGTAA